MEESEVMSTMESTLLVLAAVLKDLQTLTVAGAQWGDEGKGKIIALLAPLFDFVERFSGASNAGHTAYTPDGKKIVSHQIPCGLAAGKTCIIGRGLMFDPVRYADEYREASAILGDSVPQIWIDNQCTVWTPWHTILESWIERQRVKRSGKSINTTKRGVGPMAAIRDFRIDVKTWDLIGPRQKLIEKLDGIYENLKLLLEAELEARDCEDCLQVPAEVAELLLASSDLLARDVIDAGDLSRKELMQGSRFLFEAAQATMLDLLAGTNPFVSAGMSTAAGAAYGAVIPPKYINEVLLVAKFYPTRVGEGPFVSEIWDRSTAERFPEDHKELFVPSRVRDEFLARTLYRINNESASPADISQYLQVLQYERGASTGRGRSVGYPDLPTLRYAVEVNGSRYLALTCLDAMSGLDQIPIVVDYELPNGSIMPRGSMAVTDVLFETKPVTRVLPGWPKDIHGCRREKDLPPAARDVIRLIEQETGTHVLIVGTGPENDAIIVRPPKGSLS
jgi:adenylosuccinate synthase